MRRNKIVKYVAIGCISLVYTGCKLPFSVRKENKAVPASYNGSKDSTNTAKVKWKDFFTDSYLTTLIDSALKNNQEFNITIQEINIAKNGIKSRKGAYLPYLGLEAGAGFDKSAQYTREGAVDANLPIAPGKAMPTLLPNYLLSANFSWQADIWKQLRNSKKSAMVRYLASIEGKNFMATNLVAEIASSYYELMALDNQLDILKKNIAIYQNSLAIVKLEKESAKVTELAVRRFEAEVLKNQSRQFYIQQQIVETENKINFLVGRFPQPVLRNSQTFNDLVPDTIHAGLPSQLLDNRPDIKQAEKQLAASKLDVKVAKATFYPSLGVSANLGYAAFNPTYFLKTPMSLLYSLIGDLAAPLINRYSIKAAYYSANSMQIQAVYNYERTILNAYTEVTNQLSNISNLKKSYDLKSKQVDALTQSITISQGLFKSARADYMEVLLTQRDALESRFELVETKMKQMNARVNIYRALGGGWN
ncbi:MAG: efflux transporter outer membrane subunit [Bacteroidia bacterium]